MSSNTGNPLGIVPRMIPIPKWSSQFQFVRPAIQLTQTRKRTLTICGTYQYLSKKFEPVSYWKENKRIERPSRTSSEDFITYRAKFSFRIVLKPRICVEIFQFWHFLPKFFVVAARVEIMADIFAIKRH